MKKLKPTEFPYAQMILLGRIANEAVSEDHPEVIRSYKTFKRELWEQYNLLRRTWDFTYTEVDPYQSYGHMRAEALPSHNLKIWSGGAGNKYMEEIAPNGQTFNHIFRSVHDVLGHLRPDNNFTPLGEENAVRAHTAWFSGEALLALNLETRVQNAWIAYGPHRTCQLCTEDVIDPIFPENKYFYILPELLEF